ncbi:gastrula zinc finger protein XlCGF8.2DB-like [Folsomia candida]|uniref:Zinc finger protein 33B n=1 Tax=Folsomia candida TaxID=158441 RepID=A0A226F1L2_FOLCA|nr:gastrula zinc finger protein XlCGF8.2DB-like [Folsomia candida]OXA62826.1 Zinc finger protein 33B [Folsomia candida]
MEYNQMENWKSSYRPKAFKSKTGLTQHFLVHGPAGICKICGKTLKNQRALLIHLSYTHGHQGEMIPCEICSKAFKMPGNLRQHMNSVHATTTRTKLPCSFLGCDKTFFHNRHLTRHYNEQHSENPTRFPCTICGKEFKSKNLLNRHHITHNMERIRLPCQYVGCGKGLLNKKDLLNHCKSQHSESPHRFSCPLCGKEFNTKKEHEYHIIKHTTEKAHKCATCGWSSFRKSTLIRHEVTHQDKLSRSIFRCELCVKTFLYKSGLQLHHKNHHGTPIMHECEFCDYKVSWKPSLTFHLKRVHYRELNYECYFCGKKFFNFPELRSHCRRRHTLEN